MDEEDIIIQHLQEHKECFDRFSFDNNMRYLLKKGYNHDEAKDMILCHCELSALTFQERIHNEGYLKINLSELIAKDLRQEMKQEQQKQLHRHLRRRHRLN